MFILYFHLFFITGESLLIEVALTQQRKIQMQLSSYKEKLANGYDLLGTPSRVFLSKNLYMNDNDDAGVGFRIVNSMKLLVKAICYYYFISSCWKFATLPFFGNYFKSLYIFCLNLCFLFKNFLQQISIFFFVFCMAIKGNVLFNFLLNSFTL